MDHEDPKQAAARPTVILADDHQLLLDGLNHLLDSRYEVLAHATDGRELVELVQKFQPDVVVSDISMPHCDGLTAVQLISQISPKTRLVLVTMNNSPELVNESMRRGVSGFVLKTDASSDLVLAIDAALAGGSYISASLSRAEANDAVLVGGRGNPVLTERQSEVLRLLSQGKTMKQVADTLNISHRTVAFHKYRIMELLEIDNNADLIRYAVSAGLVTH